MNRRCGSAVAWALVLTLAVASAAFGAVPADRACRTRGPYGGGDGGLPTPFKASNQRVELADGELYTLVGHVRFYHDEPYLEVDLAEHPWLANGRRKASPFYPLASLASYWRKYEDRKIRAYVEAQGEIVSSDLRSQTPSQYLILLNPLVDPDLVE